MKFSFQIFYIFVIEIEALFWHSSPQSEAGIQGPFVRERLWTSVIILHDKAYQGSKSGTWIPAYSARQ